MGRSSCAAIQLNLLLSLAHHFKNSSMILFTGIAKHSNMIHRLEKWTGFTIWKRPDMMRAVLAVFILPVLLRQYTRYRSGSPQYKPMWETDAPCEIQRQR